MKGRFIGREDERAALMRVGSLSSDGAGPSAAVVVGAPGAGKSRLLDEVARQLGGWRLNLTGYEPEQVVPLGAARDLLQALSHTGHGGRRLHALAFGDRASGMRGAPLPLFEAAYRCLGRGQAVLVVDDAQWIDATSAALVSYLVRAAAADRMPIAFLAAGRPASTTGALRDAIVGALDADRVVELSLGPLAELSGVEMARGLVPNLSSAEASRIWAAAAGSPFWIETLAVHGGLAEGALDISFGRLSDEASGVLGAIAVIGRPAALNEIGAALGWTASRVTAGTDELRARGLAVETSGLSEAAHDLVREAATRQLPRASARRMHARLADHLVDSAQDDVAILQEALEHVRAAGQSGLELAIAIARAPGRRLVGAAGISDLATIASDADPSDRRRLELEVALAELASELGERETELDRWSAVADRADGELRARALVAAAHAAYRLGRRDLAADLIGQARATGVDDAATGIGLDALESEVLRWLDHRVAEAEQLTVRALRRADVAIGDARASGDRLPPRLREACIRALHAGYDLALQAGNEPDQVRHAKRLVTMADGELERMEAKLLLGLALRRSGRVGEGAALAREVLDEARRRIYPSVIVNASHHLAIALTNLGRMAEAEAVSMEVERMSARIGQTGRFLSEIRSLRPGIAVSRGDWRAGIDRLDADIAREPDPHYKLGIQEEIAVWLARLAGSEEAPHVRTMLAEARANLELVGCQRCGRELALRTAEALARIGEVDAASASLNARLVSGARRSREGRRLLWRAIASIRAASGRRDRAIMALERLSARLSAQGFHREVLWADLDRAGLLAGEDRQAAVRVYRSVAERTRAWGSLTELDFAKRRLRELGARVAPPRSSPAMYGLSQRELEVARLAASGLSNPEIASRLFLSRKTVERHVSRARAKSGARNRTQLATRLAATMAEPATGVEMRDLPDTSH
jgi:DNA-binding CsgD family transcriptional regulator